MTGREIEKLMKGQLTPVFDDNGKQLRMGEKIKQHTKWAGKEGVNIGVLALRYTRFESMEVE